MAGFSKKDQRSLEFVWSWYSDQTEALIDFRAKIFNLFSTSQSGIKEKFIGLTSDEFNSYFQKSKKELEHLVCFDLISSTEAILHSDYHKKVQVKRKNCNLTEKFRVIEKEKKERVSVEDDIIQVWKDVLITKKSKFSRFIGLLKYRHWLAHGRHWTPNIGQDYSPDIAYEIADVIEDLKDGIYLIKIYSLDKELLGIKKLVIE
ncbi:MAG: hypothetical protein K8S16_15690 [Bacteroidales bacterium]|nr:hypothetical protein [Bacteroidales bacterium]